MKVSHAYELRSVRMKRQKKILHPRKPAFVQRKHRVACDSSLLLLLTVCVDKRSPYLLLSKNVYSSFVCVWSIGCGTACTRYGECGLHSACVCDREDIYSDCCVYSLCSWYHTYVSVLLNTTITDHCGCTRKSSYQ